jgi:hypothetical protein
MPPESALLSFPDPDPSVDQFESDRPNVELLPLSDSAQRSEVLCDDEIGSARRPMLSPGPKEKGPSYIGSRRLHSKV